MSEPIDGEPTEAESGGTMGFACNPSERVDARHAAGIAGAARPARIRPGSARARAARLDLAYLRDQDGKRMCAVQRLG